MNKALNREHRPDSAICSICACDSPWLMKKNGHDLHQCTRCRHIQVWPPPSEESLRTLYTADQSYHIDKLTRLDAGRPPRRPILTALARILDAKKEGTFLDVGCADGELLMLARRSGFTPAGVEINPATARIAQANRIPVFVGTLLEARLPDREFDVVFLGDVIEHVSDLSPFVAEVSRLLKGDGVVFIRTPNHECFFARTTYRLYSMLKIPWSHPTPPHHVHQFTPASLEMLLEQHGFRAVRLYFGPCSLKYELGATFVFARLRSALKRRDYLRCVAHALAGALVIATYTPIWIVNRLFNGTRTDCSMDALVQRIEGDGGRSV